MDGMIAAISILILIVLVLGITLWVRGLSYHDTINDLEKRIDNLQRTSTVQETTPNYEEKIKEAERQFRQRAADLTAQLELIQENINNTKVQQQDELRLLEHYAVQREESAQSLILLKDVAQHLNEERHHLEKDKENVEKDIATRTDEYRRIEEDLVRLKNMSRSQLMVQNDEIELWELKISDNEAKLIQILKEIDVMYPDLNKDLANIEWRKIWLPKFKWLSDNHMLEDSGIYRLVLKSDNNVSYVGQAANIKNRWYTHVKKMIGVEPKGNEKVYEYRPDDFYWSVIEKGNGIDLDKSERYWIEYFCCKEKGLNKK